MGMHKYRLTDHPASGDRQLEDEPRIMVVDYVGIAEHLDDASRRLDQELLSRSSYRACATNVDEALLLVASQPHVGRSKYVAIDCQYSYVVPSSSLTVC